MTISRDEEMPDPAAMARPFRNLCSQARVCPRWCRDHHTMAFARACAGVAGPTTICAGSPRPIIAAVQCTETPSRASKATHRNAHDKVVHVYVRAAALA